MKRSLLLMLAAFVWPFVWAQDASTEPGTVRTGFFLGISYSYLSIETELNGLTYQSVWFGQDLGTVTLDDNELDTLNQQTSEIFNRHQLAVEPGMVFLDNSRWHFEGSVLLGTSRVRFKTEIDQPEARQKTVTSDFKDLVGGISLNLRYNFSERWGLSLMPHFMYSWGNTENVEDSIQPLVNFFVNDLKESFSLGYGRVNLMASYLAPNLVLSVGPGFYYSFISRTYTIDRTNPENMDQYHDQIESSLHSIAFIDACLRVDWTIIEPLTLSLEAAVGKDLFIKTGLRYHF
ncbi:MAG: hypothetical protein R6W71_05410 [Bacteroidales bacterium]|jgi:hypothetical protein